MERWLKANRRFSVIAALVFCVFLAGGIGLTGGSSFLGLANWSRWVGIGLLAFAFPLGCVAFIASRPKVTREKESLRIHLGGLGTYRLPLEVVECFFMGQGPTELPAKHLRDAEAVNVIVRLAERAEPWKHREVNPLFGRWCDGYITIRGAWCEPLNQEVVERLNHRLAAAKREKPVHHA